MPFIETTISGLLLFEPVIYSDSRGHFYESYSKEIFAKAGLDMNFIQDNQSLSSFGVIRGLHYQVDPHAQGKLVRVLQGSIWDVAVDMRKGSPSFGKCYGVELTAENNRQLLVPRGFAHGFSVLSDQAVVMYKCDAPYNKEAEAGILYNDPQLGIDWKVPENKVIISDKDILLPSFKNCKNNFVFNS